jgi:hypothetical protein
MLDQSGRLFGKVNVIDFTLLAFLFLVALGIVAVQSGWHQTSSQVIEGETDIEYTLYLRNVKTLDPEKLFLPNQMVSMTIRNQPRGDVRVVSVHYKPKQAIIPKGDGGYVTVPDPDDQHGFDYLVRVRDHALVGKEGYVTNGVKVKVGTNILVENFLFRLPGMIIDIEDMQKANPAVSD